MNWEAEKIKRYYTENLKGKNWGEWPDGSEWPDVGITYTISQYQTGGRRPMIYDILKMQKPITYNLEHGTRFILSGQRKNSICPVRVDGSI